MPDQLQEHIANDVDDQVLRNSSKPEPTMQHRLVNLHESNPTRLIIRRANSNQQGDGSVFV
jgi:hypothetical protein